MIEDTPNSNFSSLSKYRHVIGVGKLEAKVWPPHSSGGGGSEAAAVVASMSNEAAATAVGSSRWTGTCGRPRRLMIYRSMV